MIFDLSISEEQIKSVRTYKWDTNEKKKNDTTANNESGE